MLNLRVGDKVKVFVFDSGSPSLKEGIVERIHKGVGIDMDGEPIGLIVGVKVDSHFWVYSLKTGWFIGSQEKKCHIFPVKRSNYAKRNTNVTNGR